MEVRKELEENGLKEWLHQSSFHDILALVRHIATNNRDFGVHCVEGKDEDGKRSELGDSLSGNSENGEVYEAGDQRREVDGA